MLTHKFQSDFNVALKLIDYNLYTYGSKTS